MLRMNAAASRARPSLHMPCSAMAAAEVPQLIPPRRSMSASTQARAASSSSPSIRSKAAAGAWLLERLAGVAPAADGYRRVRLEPVLDRAIGGMRARYHSASGPIGVTWRFEGDGIRYCASLPCGTEGELRLPCDLGDICVARGEAGIAGRRCADGVTTLTLRSGEYEFMIQCH